MTRLSVDVHPDRYDDMPVLKHAITHIAAVPRPSGEPIHVPSHPESVTGDDVTAGEWFVLHTRPRQEKAVARSLDARAVEHLLPLRIKVRYERRRKVRSQLPLFPGYVFLRGTIEQAYAVDRTGRIAQVIQVADQARLARELKQIQFATQQGGDLEPAPYLTAGRRVAVIGGPFQGLIGVVEAVPTNNRLVLQVETLGQAASLEIDCDLLEPID
ncbi:MAG: hypothetical protein CMJ49_00610 [Planctomycetaceae bacterium]|nr:hypothetical protein [Planctomycetaceae bacterium]